MIRLQCSLVHGIPRDANCLSEQTKGDCIRPDLSWPPVIFSKSYDLARPGPLLVARLAMSELREAHIHIAGSNIAGAGYEDVFGLNRLRAPSRWDGIGS